MKKSSLQINDNCEFGIGYFSFPCVILFVVCGVLSVYTAAPFCVLVVELHNYTDILRNNPRNHHHNHNNNRNHNHNHCYNHHNPPWPVLLNKLRLLLLKIKPLLLIFCLSLLLTSLIYLLIDRITTNYEKLLKNLCNHCERGSVYL